jgi:hypothetical protein
MLQQLNKIKIVFIFLSFFFHGITFQTAWAQDEEEEDMSDERSSQEDDLMKSMFEDLSIVGGGGLTGAILGLSTLSFEKYPSQHTSHIITGASIGIIIGVAIIMYNKVSKGSDLMESAFPLKNENYWASQWRHSWEENHLQTSMNIKNQFPTLYYTKSF